MDTLFIIGNGFDIAHDIKTSYLYFKKFVYEQAYGEDEELSSLKKDDEIRDFFRKKDCDIKSHAESSDEPAKGFKDIYRYPLPTIDSSVKECYQFIYRHLTMLNDEEDFWSSFESELGYINYAHTYLPENIGDYDICKQAELLKDLISKHLSDLFRKWIESTWEETVRTNVITKDKHSILNHKNAYFLTFNYTPVLEYHYKIPENQICHIHGSIKEKQYIFGHNRVLSGEELKVYEGDMYSYLNPLVEKMKKPVQDQLEKHKDFFDSLSEVKTIYISGFRVSYLKTKVVYSDHCKYEPSDGIDFPYLREIFKKAPNAEIYVDEHDKKQKEEIQEVLSSCGAQKAYDLQFINTDKDEIVKVK